MNLGDLPEEPKRQVARVSNTRASRSYGQPTVSHFVEEINRILPDSAEIDIQHVPVGGVLLPWGRHGRQPQNTCMLNHIVTRQ